MKNKYHLLVGPLPPVEGGITLLFSSLLKGLSCVTDTKVVDINHTKSKYKILFWVMDYMKIIYLAFQSRSISFHLTARGVYVYGPLMLLMVFLGKKVIFRKFAGSFDLEYTSRGWYYKYLVGAIFKYSNLVLLETQHLIKFFENEFSVSKIKLFSNHRDLTVGKVRGSSQRSIKKYLYLGLVDEAKGLDIVIDLFSQEGVEGLPDIDIYGHGDKNIIDKISIIPKLNYAGVVSNNLVMDKLCEYDFIIFPTKHKGEGIPGVLIESMSCGLVPIASTWRSVPEIVKDTCGILFAPNSSRELMCALDEARELSNAEFNVLSDESIERSKMYSSEYWVSEYFNMLEELDN